MNDKRSLFDETLVQRVCAEYMEMPGMRLTCPQAQRLWGLDRATCFALLEFLVDTSFLCRPVPGLYGRPTDGQAAHVRPRMAAARLDGAVRVPVKQAV